MSRSPHNGGFLRCTGGKPLPDGPAASRAAVVSPSSVRFSDRPCFAMVCPDVGHLFWHKEGHKPTSVVIHKFASFVPASPTSERLNPNRTRIIRLPVPRFRHWHQRSLQGHANFEYRGTRCGTNAGTGTKLAAS